uniref:Uncharacterized protein n=1 Tax=Thermosphaera aggregans TaxID=54254 RepID=A0A7C2FPU1_9CREN
MQDKVLAFIFMFTVLVVVSSLSLSLTGEGRVDLYASLSILAYYVSYALTRPVTTYKQVRILNIVLLALFALIIAYRVYGVLSS